MEVHAGNIITVFVIEYVTAVIVMKASAYQRCAVAQQLEHWTLNQENPETVLLPFTQLYECLAIDNGGYVNE